MKTPSLVVLAISAMLSIEQSAPTIRPDPPMARDDCEEWNRQRDPFKLFGNTYYVGTAGLSSLLIATSDGLILLDGAMPQSAPLIDASIRKLGFRTEDVRLILNSHAHTDHAGGIAALQRVSGARVGLGLASVVSDERGEFELALTRAVTSDVLMAVKAGFRPARLERPGEPGPDRSGWPDDVTLVLAGPALAVRGVVLDHEEKPVSGARVWIHDPTPGTVKSASEVWWPAAGEDQTEQS